MWLPVVHVKLIVNIYLSLTQIPKGRFCKFALSIWNLAKWEQNERIHMWKSIDSTAFYQNLWIDLSAQLNFTCASDVKSLWQITEFINSPSYHYNFSPWDSPSVLNCHSIFSRQWPGNKALVIGTKVGPSATAGVISQFLKPIIKQVQKVDLEK